MMRNYGFVLAACSVVLLGGGPASSADPKKVFSYTESRYAEIDPGERGSANDERLILALWDGLTMLDPATGKVVPGTALRWDTSADGRTWTFYLRDAVWSDGKPVKAQDFVYAWGRILEPANKKHGADLLRPIQGCAAILDALITMGVLDAASTGIKDLLGPNPVAIPADKLEQLLKDTGVRPYIEHLDNSEVRRMIKWGSDPFPKEKAEKAREAIRDERKKHKQVLNDGLAAFGKTAGAFAKDDKTLVVQTDGLRPYLPELLARATFVPLRSDKIEGKNAFTPFEAAEFVGNGPFVLKSRGARPRPGQDKADSGIEIVRSPTYKGPAPAAMDVVMCWTDLGPQEDMVRFKQKTVQWIANPAPESEKGVEKNPAFRTRGGGSLLYMVIRSDYRDPGKPTSKPLEKLEARKAFALTIDRARLAKSTWPAAEVADRIVPPGVRGRSGGPQALALDASQAKTAFQSLGVKPEDFPWIELFREDDPGLSPMGIAILETWKKHLGLDASEIVRTSQAEDDVKVRGGRYAFLIEEWGGDWNDPSNFIEIFHSKNPQGHTGWKDEAVDAMIEGSVNVEALIAAPDKALSGAQDSAGLKAKIEAAKGGSADAKEALRLMLLAQAEQRLLSQCIVVPLLWRRQAELVQEVKGIGSDDAWKNPAFFGSLRSVTK